MYMCCHLWGTLRLYLPGLQGTNNIVTWVTVWVVLVTRKSIISPSQKPNGFLLVDITRTSVCWMIQGLLVITWNIWAILNQSRPDSKYPLKDSLYWPQAECCRPHHGTSGQDPFPFNVMLTRWIRASIPSQAKVSQCLLWNFYFYKRNWAYIS